MKKLLSAILALALILCLAPAALADKDEDDVPYAVEGGNIYFDKATGTITGADREITAADIPASIDGVAVISIGNEAFSDCDSLTSVTILNGVRSIEWAAFADCASLTSVTIPDSVTLIGESAFVDCDALASVTIPNSVTSIEAWAFGGCSSLTSVIIPDSVISIEAFAFDGCSSLTSVTILSSVTSIGVLAFGKCDSLTDIYYCGSQEQWNSALLFDEIDFFYDYYYNLCGYYFYDTDKVTVHFNSSGPSFTDAQPGGAYTDAVKWAVEKGYADAASATEFGAVKPCPRWEVVSILWRAMGCPEPSADAVNPFTDVSESAPYYKAVLWAYEQGITTGTSDTTFGPNDTVERGAAVTFIHRAAETPATAVSNPFTDAPADSVYTPAILWAVKEGITNGASATLFDTFAPVERGQMVTFLYRWFTENK